MFLSSHKPTPPRTKRLLNVDAPKTYHFTTQDGAALRLTRYQGGDKGPVMLVHGLGVSSEIFSTDMIDINLLEYLFANGYDVWLLDFRVSTALPVSKNQCNGDQVAQYDFPAAVSLICKEAGSKDIQAVVHCYGATTFFMSMLAGLQGIRSIVCSQIATHMVLPKATKVKTGLHFPEVLQALGVKSLTAYTDGSEDGLEILYDKALSVYALAEAQGRCNNPTCHRITFMYAPLYRHDQLSPLLHTHLNELFGVGNMTTFSHLALMCRKGHLVNAQGEDVYLPNLHRLNLPICFISGADNQCYFPQSTQATYDLLRSQFSPSQYTRHVVEGYAHIDCIFGKNAVEDVYPLILEHLEATVEVVA